jgi:hypothetical protein
LYKASVSLKDPPRAAVVVEVALAPAAGCNAEACERISGAVELWGQMTYSLGGRTGVARVLPVKVGDLGHARLVLASISSGRRRTLDVWKWLL